VPPRRRTAPAYTALAAAAAGLAWVLWPAGPPAPEPAAPPARPAPPGPLDGRVAALHRLLARKCALADDLLAGRLGLAGAVERQLAAEAAEPDAQAEVRRNRERTYPGLPEREAAARNFALCAAAVVPDAERRDAVADWLAWELDVYLRGTGPADSSRPRSVGPGR
jgi:hypothetical protein